MHEEQKKLIAVALEEKEAKGRGKKVYQYKVHEIFFEALSSAYPLFYAYVEQKKFEKVVYEFMSFGAKSLDIWKMPNEFRKFIKKKKLFREIAFVDELLWFEWSEVALMMKNYNIQTAQNFSYKNNYKLSKSCILKKLNYKVFEKGSFEEKGTYFLLGFYDFSEFRVVYKEISLPLYIFLKKMHKKGLKEAIACLSKMSGQSKKEVKEFFRDTLYELHSLHILSRN